MLDTLEKLFKRFRGRKAGLTSAAFLRIGLAGIMIVLYVWYAPVHRAVWGPAAQIDHASYVKYIVGTNPLALYRYATTTIVADSIYYASIVVALLYLFGFAPRLVCWWFFITVYAYVDRDTLAGDAGQRLVVLLAFLLCFMDTSRFALLPMRLRVSRWWLIKRVDSMLHNSARFLIFWQVCMVYFWAAFYKLGGSEWRHGTALSHVLHLQRFQFIPGLSAALAAHTGASAIATFLTLTFQMGFPFLMWTRRYKPYLIVAALATHLGIALIMGLITFSLTMIVADLSLLDDDQWSALVRKGRSVTSWIATMITRLRLFGKRTVET